jgi:hypothetical protein
VTEFGELFASESTFCGGVPVMLRVFGVAILHLAMLAHVLQFAEPR